MTELEQQIVRELQSDIPLSPRPFYDIAHKLGISEEELIGKIREFQAKGVIRRFGAILKHREAGIKANAMVVWKVPAERVDEVGSVLAAHPKVSHCYERVITEEWPYNIFSMIHGQTKEECYEIIGDFKEQIGIREYAVLFSTSELKKISMQYFPPNSADS